MGEGEKTVKIMKRIAKMNGKKVSIEQKNATSDGYRGWSSATGIFIYFR